MLSKSTRETAAESRLSYTELMAMFLSTKIVLVSWLIPQQQSSLGENAWGLCAALWYIPNEPNPIERGARC
jgi:hypothetical protein